jgi:tetraacyldisaccharide 4'-kinase
VADGKGVKATVRDSGDEAQVLARALPGTPIVADGQRIRGAAKAKELSLPADLFLLDDGFSHVRISRDVDIVLIDASFPDAGGAFLPAGLLREPLSSLSRADLIVITKTEQADPEQARALCERHARGIPVFHARTEILGIKDPTGLDVDPANIYPGTVVAVSGLARPGAFDATLRTLGIAPTESLVFPDHARYTSFRIGRIQRALEETGATALITTEKDAVKLENEISVPIFSVAIQMAVIEQNFPAEVLARLSRQVS